MGQSQSIRTAAQQHPTVFIFLIADDTHVVGPPADVIAAIITIRRLYATIDLSLPEKADSKNVL